MRSVWRTSLRAASGALVAGTLADRSGAPVCGWNPFAKRKWSPPETLDQMFEKASGINKPTAGYRSVKALPEGPAAFQLYSLATPNGAKVSILLEELGLDYDAHTVSIAKEEQFTTGFVSVNPNSKIPAAIDKQGPGGKPQYLWESAAIMWYLAEKHGKFLPKDARLKQECMQWLFFQMGGGERRRARPARRSPASLAPSRPPRRSRERARCSLLSFAPSRAQSGR